MWRSLCRTLWEAASIFSGQALNEGHNPHRTAHFITGLTVFPRADVTCLPHMLSLGTGLDPKASTLSAPLGCWEKSRGPQLKHSLRVYETVSGVCLFFAVSLFTPLGNLTWFPSALPLARLRGDMGQSICLGILEPWGEIWALHPVSCVTLEVSLYLSALPFLHL